MSTGCNSLKPNQIKTHHRDCFILLNPEINDVQVQNDRGFKGSATHRRDFIKNPADCIYSRTQLLQTEMLDWFWSAPLLADDTPRFFGGGGGITRFRILKRSWHSQCNYLACRIFCVKIILNSKVYYCTRVSLTQFLPDVSGPCWGTINQSLS